jgi:tetratricopeptide (TPR) repeat protein
MKASLCTAMVLLSLTSRAEEPSLVQAEAEQHFHVGMRSYNLGDFAAAIREFRRAYELTEEPGLLFNLGQASRLNKQPERALHYYQTYLRLMPDAPNRSDVEQFIDSCRRMARSDEPARPSPAVWANREPRPRPPAVEEAPSPFARPPAAPPPAGPIVADRPAPRPQTSPPRPSRTLLVAGVTVGAIGLASLASAIALGVEAETAERELSRLAAADGTWDARQRALYRDGEREAPASTALYAIGGAALATGVVLTIVGARKARPRVSASVIPDAAGLRCAF